MQPLRTSERKTSMRIRKYSGGKTTAAIASLIAALCANSAHALPSFARQTGKPCAQCHTVAYGPALTSYGRNFKLNGYVWGDVTALIAPLAVMVPGGFTAPSKSQVEPPAEATAANTHVSVEKVSFFYLCRC